MMRDDDFAEGIYSIMKAADYKLGGGRDIGSGVRYKNEVFETIPFQWDCPHDIGFGYGECPDDCLMRMPNFRHFQSGLEVTWYKRVGRSTKSNIGMKDLDWYKIVVECLESVRDDD